MVTGCLSEMLNKSNRKSILSAVLLCKIQKLNILPMATAVNIGPCLQATFLLFSFF